MFYTKTSNVECIKILAEYGANDDCMALICHNENRSARANIDIECALTLIENGASVNYKNINGDSILTIVSRHTDNIASVKCIDCLIKRGADVNLQNVKGETALMTIAKYCNGIASGECMTTLIKNGANINHVCASGETALAQVTKECLNDHGATCLKILVTHGATIYNCCLVRIAYKSATSFGVDCAKILIEAGASVDAAIYLDYTPLIMACSNFVDEQSVKFIRQLIEHGADPNLKTKNKMQTALMIILNDKKLLISDFVIEYVEILLQAGTDPNLQSDDGCTALMNACDRDISDFTIECVEILLRSGADPNLQKSDGRTALMLHCERLHCNIKYRNNAIIRLLMSYGANYELLDRNNRSVFSSMSRLEANIDVVKIICGNNNSGYENPRSVKSAANLGHD